MRIQVLFQIKRAPLLILLPLLLSSKVSAESSVDEIQKEALELLKSLPGSQSGNAERQVQKVFDHYGSLTRDSALPGSAEITPKIAPSPVKHKPKSQPSSISMAMNGSSYRNLPADAYPEDRDPFALTHRLVKQKPIENDARRGAGESNTRSYSFTRLNTGIDVPKLSLRGLVRKSAQDKAAILEVEGLGTYVVREGDTITIPSGGFNNVIKVTQIDRLSLLIEVGKLGEVIVVR